MPDHSDHYSNLLRFWRSMEILTLPDIPDYTLKRWKGEDNPHILTEGKALPWAPGQMSPAKEGRKWKYTLFFYIVPKESVVEWMARLSHSTDDYREKTSGETCLSALVLNESGRPIPRGYAPAAFIHAIRLIRESRNQHELSDLLRYAQDDYTTRFGLPEDTAPITWTTLEKELTYLTRLAGNLIPTHPVICIPTEAAATAVLEAPFLNSAYLHDLDRLILHPQEIGRPLETLLTPNVDIAARKDVLHPRILLERIDPGKQSPGRWPADPAHGLYTAQQAALQLALPTLRQEGGLLGINGPPGTGKTTLLREIITDVVVARARRILEAGVDDLFSRKWTLLGAKAGFYELNKDVFDDQGIVVSGNNNAAIEHISKELPLPESIAGQAFPEAGYFPAAATTIFEQPCWAMLTAALGRFEKKSAFVSKFWFAPRTSFGAFLKEQDTHDNRDEYAKTAAALHALLKEYQAYQSLAAAYHERLLAGHVDDGLAKRLVTDYGLTPASIPDLTFLHTSPQALHALTPYSGERLHLLRSHIFLRSLQLHEWAIRCNARSFRSNLGAFIDMLSGKYRDGPDNSASSVSGRSSSVSGRSSSVSGGISHRTAATLWNGFFFCVPVVSVTLASFARQFPKMGAGSLGWLLLDEAGQAALPSVCGPLWRAKRAILIGDTLQIPPVVTTPRALGTLLQKTYGIAGDCWSPADHSAQFLADRATAHGTYVHAAGSRREPRAADPTGLHDAQATADPPGPNIARTWTGIPLRAHRRCGEPMFSISNTIAYNGQMVRVGPKVPEEPSSGWIDVRGDGEAGNHLIPAEVEVVGDLLKELKADNGAVFVISPFKSIAETCANRYNDKERRIACGTIHTFQGKEADIVLLILGTTADNKRARDWVAASPNMLNVAVTRARHRLYVIGNRPAWSAHRYFDQLARMLPVKEHLTGRLF
jgi:AAA domain